MNLSRGQQTRGQQDDLLPKDLHTPPQGAKMWAM